MALKENIKQWFKTGRKPDESQFYSFFDSIWFKEEKIPAAKIENLQEILDDKADAEALENHKNDLNAHSNLLIQARIIPQGEMTVYKVYPNTDLNQREKGDYCMGIVQNTFVSGNWNGGAQDLRTSYE